MQYNIGSTVLVSGILLKLFFTETVRLLLY
jgi:hypothetical protein